jgi:hypothetical protein
VQRLHCRFIRNKPISHLEDEGRGGRVYWPLHNDSDSESEEIKARQSKKGDGHKYSSYLLRKINILLLEVCDLFKMQVSLSGLLTGKAKAHCPSLVFSLIEKQRV